MPRGNESQTKQQYHLRLVSYFHDDDLVYTMSVNRSRSSRQNTVKFLNFNMALRHHTYTCGKPFHWNNHQYERVCHIATNERTLCSREQSYKDSLLQKNPSTGSQNLVNNTIEFPKYTLLFIQIVPEFKLKKEAELKN